MSPRKRWLLAWHDARHGIAAVVFSNRMCKLCRKSLDEVSMQHMSIVYKVRMPRVPIVTLPNGRLDPLRCGGAPAWLKKARKILDGPGLRMTIGGELFAQRILKRRASLPAL